ncbi:MAG: hypothetical protein K6G15_03445 [Desulfovibrio sp.]|nr:hypothetical protein [Desulfovibrio sp.]
MSIYGLELHTFGQCSYYTSSQTLALGDKVIVQEEERLCFGTVCSGPFTTLANYQENDLPEILRVADDNDLIDNAENQRLCSEAREFCAAAIERRKLEMKLVGVEVFFDRSKIIFFFTAPTRIDFRELVKDLVRQYRTRIELRQIGVRHETQMIGAVGNCGMICCCRRYLRKFAPVTIRMAKEQNLFLNPSKISGSCGRLLCCLSYEQENYDNFFAQSPRPGKKYQTKQGILRVVRINMFRNTVAAAGEDNEEREWSLDQWLTLNPQRLDPLTFGEEGEGEESVAERETYLAETLPDEPLENLTDSEREPEFELEYPVFAQKKALSGRSEGRQDRPERKERKGARKPEHRDEPNVRHKNRPKPDSAPEQANAKEHSADASQAPAQPKGKKREDSRPQKFKKKKRPKKRSR